MREDKRIHVLCVEDNPHDLALIRDALAQRAENFEVLASTNRQSFEKALAKGGFDVVLTDFNILGYEGLQVIQEVKKHRPDVPIILLTGTGSEEVAVTALKTGAADYIIKSVKHILRLPDTILNVLKHQQIQKALDEKNANLCAVLENISDGILVVDEQNTILYANPTAGSMLGNPPEKLAGQKFEHDITQTQPAEITLLHHAEGAVFAEIRIAETTWGGKKSWIISLRDITERKRAEEKLAENQRRLAHILSLSPAIIHALNTRGTPTWVSNNVTSILGYTVEEVMHPHWWQDHIHPQDRKKALAAGVRALQGEALTHEYRFRKKNGEWIWLRHELRPVSDGEKDIAVIGSWTDITDLKLAEEALQKSERELRLRNEISQIFLTVPQENIYREILAVILKTTKSRSGLFGYVDEKENLICPAITPDIEDLFQEQDRVILLPKDSWSGLWGQALLEKKTLFSNEPLEVPEGHISITRAVAVPILFAGDLIGALIVANKKTPYLEEDVALLETIANHIAPILYTRLQLDKETQAREKFQEQLLQAQKLESVGRLAGGVAHDFNNMLTAIIGYAEMILQLLPPQDPLCDTVKAILDAGKHSATLTNQLLAFSRKQTLQPQVVTPNKLIGGLENMIRRLIGEDIDLRLSLAKNVWSIRVDPGQFDQVIMNLVVNARDAMPTGGTLTIETANVMLDERCVETHPDIEPGNYVMISVSDTGCGMDRETLQRIFEPFFTTKERGKGTGLGLSVVYGIVKQSGGYIWVYSEPGQGTTFKIYLPQVEEEIQPKMVSPEEKKDVEFLGTGNILVVEDEDAVRKLIEEILSEMGFQVYPTASGDEAISLLEKQNLKPDLVITDVILPSLSGPELMKRLHKSYPGLKALYMSGYTDDKIAHHGFLEPGTLFLQKPFTIRDLKQKVRSILTETD
jgi:PAS domain S-box-containing protein